MNYKNHEGIYARHPRGHSDLDEWSGHGHDSAPAHSYNVKWNLISLWEACSGFCIFRWKAGRGKQRQVAHQVGWLADYLKWDNEYFTDNSEQTFRLLSLTTSSTFSSDCISFNLGQEEKDVTFMSTDYNGNFYNNLLNQITITVINQLKSLFTLIVWDVAAYLTKKKTKKKQQ